MTWGGLDRLIEIADDRKAIANRISRQLRNAHQRLTGLDRLSDLAKSGSDWHQMCQIGDFF